MILIRIPAAILAIWLSVAMPGVAVAQESAGQPVLGLILVKEQAKAEEILARIKAGDSFEVLAKQHSIDSTADAGGYLGPVELANVRPINITRS